MRTPWLLILVALFSSSCSGAGNTTYTNTKHNYSVQTSTVWGVKAEDGTPAEADKVVLFRVVDAPGKKAAYDPKTLLSGEQPFNGNILTVTVTAMPNPEKLEPLEFLKKEEGTGFDPAEYEQATFAGKPAVRQTRVGGQRYFLNVDQTLFCVWGIELFGRDSDMGRSLPSNPEAVKILQQTMDSVKFGPP